MRIEKRYVIKTESGIQEVTEKPTDRKTKILNTYQQLIADDGKWIKNDKLGVSAQNWKLEDNIEDWVEIDAQEL